jgi:hypothetical protein
MRLEADPWTSAIPIDTAATPAEAVTAAIEALGNDPT